MPTPTYTPLATVTLGSSASSVTFSSIPATYRDLIFIIDGNLVSSSDNVTVRYNGDSGSNYSSVEMSGNGSTTFSGTQSGTQASVGAAYTNRGTNIIQVMDYTSTDKHKTGISRFSTAGNAVGAFASRWANTAAVTSVRIGLTAQSFATGTTFSLYGVIA
jgi:hypothetical protein